MTTEPDLIERIRSLLGRRGSRLVRGPGDDASVVKCDGLAVVSVDAFVEGVHFRLATTSLADLGHKCLAASLSDLAAMGAEAGEAYFALALPPHMGDREVLELMDGAERLAAERGVSICGGDLSASDELFVAVTAVGHAADTDNVVGRDGARAGDEVGVTGLLGGSGAGLILLERKEHGLPGLSSLTIGEALIARQRRPQPRLAEGRALAHAGVHAMIDVSDGVASDARRLAHESGVAIEIELASLPLDEGVEAVAELAGTTPEELAATGGEDYELLFTAPPRGRAEIESALAATETPVTWIGTVSEGAGLRVRDASGAERRLDGWDHFAVRSAAGRTR